MRSRPSLRCPSACPVNGDTPPMSEVLLALGLSSTPQKSSSFSSGSESSAAALPPVLTGCRALCSGIMAAKCTSSSSASQCCQVATGGCSAMASGRQDSLQQLGLPRELDYTTLSAISNAGSVRPALWLPHACTSGSSDCGSSLAGVPRTLPTAGREQKIDFCKKSSALQKKATNKSGGKSGHCHQSRSSS